MRAQQTTKERFCSTEVHEVKKKKYFRCRETTTTIRKQYKHKNLYLVCSTQAHTVHHTLYPSYTHKMIKHCSIKTHIHKHTQIYTACKHTYIDN